jgi:N-acetylglucosamine kinase-like BadF-type ATPase
MTLAMTRYGPLLRADEGRRLGVTRATAAGGFAMSGQSRPLYCIDAGGSGTSVRAWNGEHWSLPPVNPSSVGRDSSDGTLADLFCQIRAQADRGDECARGTSARPAIWLASASVDRATATVELRRITSAVRAAGLYAEIVVTNDVTPLILGAPPDAGHIVAVCGTGSAFLATDGRSALVRVGGCEYLGSDEGSAFDLGLRGLRSAVCGLDGRGQRTALSELLAAEAGVPVPELSRKLARMPFPKAAVAALAPVVLRAWLDGDRAAADLVDAVIGELVVGMRAVRDAAAVAPGWYLSVAGGVVNGCPDFFDRVAVAATGLGARHVVLVSDPTTVLLEALARLAVTDPMNLSDPRIDQEAWYLDCADRTADPHGKTDQ